MSEKEFSGKTALVTGGSRGIGRALALKLARNGANLAINYLSRDSDAQEAKGLIEQQGVGCVLVKGNVAEPAEVEAMVAETRQAFGSIELLVANAAISISETHEEISWETWKKTLSINLDGPFLCIQAVKDEMLANGYGRIVCISSVAALRPRKMFIHYGASKAGLVGLVRCCSQALAPTIRVNCVAPGLTDTEMSRTVVTEEAIQAMVEATPLGRMAQPEEMANVAYFLLSDQSSFMTGQTLVASGGRVTLP